ncbi:hypothetical protein KCU87_g123, partial [Aureobasidium melanogenum]
LVYLQAWWNRSGYWEQFTAPEDICTSLLLLVGSPARLFSARLFYSPKVRHSKMDRLKQKNLHERHGCCLCLRQQVIGLYSALCRPEAMYSEGTTTELGAPLGSIDSNTDLLDGLLHWSHDHLDGICIVALVSNSLFPIIVRRLRATYPHELVAQQPKVPLKPSTRDVTSILALIVWPTRFGCRSRPCNLEESAQQVRTHVEALRRSTQIDVVLRFLRAAVAVRRTVGCQRLMRTTRQIVLAEEQFRESSVVKPGTSKCYESRSGCRRYEA